MFYSLLIVTFLLAVIVTLGVIFLFNHPLKKILQRIIQDEISQAWHRYILFATFVVGVSGGVRIHELERYISAPHSEMDILVLNSQRWTLEIYRTIIQTLQSIAWMFLVVFIFALLAYVIVRGFEIKKSK